jgi:hypothetical protein
MPAERLPMRCVREILRLKADGLSDPAIAPSARLARSTVGDYVGCAVAPGLTWRRSRDPLAERIRLDHANAAIHLRGRALASWGRGKRGQDVSAELKRLRDTAMVAGLVRAAAALEITGLDG